jgi:hypothetical protein
MGSSKDLQDRVDDFFLKVAGLGMSSRRGFLGKVGKAVFGAFVLAAVRPQFAWATEGGACSNNTCELAGGDDLDGWPQCYVNPPSGPIEPDCSFAEYGPEFCGCVVNQTGNSGGCFFIYTRCWCCDNPVACIVGTEFGCCYCSRTSLFGSSCSCNGS